MLKLPLEIENKIYKKYFSDYILKEIKPKCFYHFKIGPGRPRNSNIRCNFNTIDSAFCIGCYYNFKCIN